MPELPDIRVYTAALAPRTIGATLTRAIIKSPFLLRTFEPQLESCIGRTVRAVSRLGKRIVIELDADLFLVFHLMIAGRLLWKAPAARPTGKIDLAAFEFSGPARAGTLVLTEASPRKRAALHIIAGAAALASLAPVGLDVLSCPSDAFEKALTRERRTLKRALTDPRAFDGIGNAYSDEILWQARLSPVAMTTSLEPDDLARLHAAARDVLSAWTSRLLDEFALTPAPADPRPLGRFPGVGDITAFRPDFQVHGRFAKPCRACACPIQRIVRAENEVNYCPGCQTRGRILADRSLSRLLKDDWPRTIEEWERL